MHLRKLLEEKHGKEQAIRIAEFIGRSESKFAELVSFDTGEDRIHAQRGSRPIVCCADTHPDLVLPFLEDLLENLRRTDLHDGVKRNTMKVVAESELPASLHGLAADIAFQLLSSPEVSVAARVHAMTVLQRICKVEPDLAGELRMVIEHLLPFESKPGFLSKARRVLKALDRS